METVNKGKWEDLNLSVDEIKNIGEALKKEEFRNLLLEYVKEINDPENRKRYEKEITQLENERGVDIKFIHPSPGYVIKTSVNGKSKAFINVCTNINIGKPSSTPDINGGQRGLNWSLPYCLPPPREDLDKTNNSCVVYDVIFHPDTLSMTKDNAAFKKLVDETAINAVEDNFKVSLDKINLKFPKLQFKGLKRAAAIRKKIENFQGTECVDIPNYPYPPIDERDVNQPDSKPTERISSDKKNSTSDSDYTIPTYVIKHRNNADLQDCTNGIMSKMAVTIPNEIVVVINLPLLKNSSDISIDVNEKSLLLVSEKPVKYKLNLNLPYTVEDTKGNAKFDTVKKVLTVTLPVVKPKILSHLDFSRDDSGVESDGYCGRNNNTSSSDDDGANKTYLLNEDEDNKVTPLSVPKTDASIIIPKVFLNPKIHYVLPNYSSQLEKSTLTFTLQVPNVNPGSIKYQFLNSFSGFWLSFFSVGTGFFPINYAMCVLLPHEVQIDNTNFKVEVWDNNVIVQVNLLFWDTAQPLSYQIGIEESNMKKCVLPTPIDKLEHIEENEDIVDVSEKWTVENVEALNNPAKFKDTKDPENSPSAVTKKIEKRILSLSLESVEDESQDENNIEVSTEIKDDHERSDCFHQEDKLSEGTSFDRSTSPTNHQPTKSRTKSESYEGDEMRKKKRGILKIGRSLSESSVDDYASWSNEKMEKTKKTVRFSEVIYKQTFRMNSSILGQRKKNQRKMRNKKRAQERRLSESGGESEGESEVMSFKKNNVNINDIDIWVSDLETSDVSEVSDTSISESDDGQKEEIKPSLPCSSKKNHKRRGKKSARKNANTAKLQFMDH